MSTKGGPKIENYRYQLAAVGGFFSGVIVNWVNGDGSISEGEMFYNGKTGGNLIDIPCGRWGSFSYRDRGFSKRGDEIAILLDPTEPIPPQYKGVFAFPGNIRLTRIAPCDQFNNFSYLFDGGTSSYAAIASTGNLSFGNGTTDSPFSFSSWINMTDATGFPILCKYQGTDEEWAFIVDSSDKIRMVLYDANAGTNVNIGRTWNTPVTSYEGQWAHVAVTYDGTGIGGLKIYWDGVRVDDTNISNGSYTAMTNTPVDINIARFTGSSTELAEGYIDEISVFNSELSQADIDSIYNLGKPNDLNSLNPLSWWRMGDNANYFSFGQWEFIDSGSGNNNAYINSTVNGRINEVP